MRKTFTLFIIMALLVLTLTGCSEKEFSITYDVTGSRININIPDKSISNANVSINSFVVTNIEGPSTILSIPVIDYSFQETYATIKNDLITLFPDYSNIIESLNIESDIEYSGTSLFGTSYYSIRIRGINSTIPIQIESSNNPILYNGNESNVINTTISISDKSTSTIDFQTFESSISGLSIDADFTSTSPIITYSFFHNKQAYPHIEKELIQAGLKVDMIDEYKIVCHEKYTTDKDFANVFPVRLYSLFNVISKVSCEHKNSVFDKLNLSIIFADVPIDLYFTITANEKTIIKINNETTANVSKQIKVSSNTIISANCNEINISKLSTTLLAILAISFVIAGMCILAIKSNKTINTRS